MTALQLRLDGHHAVLTAQLVQEGLALGVSLVATMMFEFISNSTG